MGSPISNLTVGVQNSGGYWISNNGTGPDGSYLVCAPVGEWKLFFHPSANAGDYGPMWWYAPPNVGTYYISEASLISVPHGSTHPNPINIQLALGGIISGIVTDIEGNPILDVDIAAVNGEGFGINSGWTNSKGEYSFRVPAGDWRISFNTWPTDGYFLSEWHENKLTLNEADLVPVNTGTPSRVNARLEKGGKIAGTVSDPSGNPVKGACVNAHDTQDNHWVAGAGTNSEGYYFIRLPAGSYNVSADPCGLGGNLQPTSYANNPVSVSLEQTNSPINLQFGYTITASCGPNGSISPAGSISVPPGESRTFTITPDNGYVIADVQVDGSSVGTPSPYSFSNVAAHHTIYASFSPAPINYTITATSGPNGSIAPAGSISVPYGGNLDFSLSPDWGYFILDVLVDGSSVGAVSSYTFFNITTNHTIEASFSQINYTITASSGPNGSISPAGPISVPQGGSQTFSITSDPGYVISDVHVNGSPVGAVSSYTFSDVSAHHTIVASFSSIPSGIIEGKVTSDGTTGIPAVGVGACEVAPNNCPYWTTTGTDGTYRLLVPGGTLSDPRKWIVDFNPYPGGIPTPGIHIFYLPQWFNGQSDFNNATEVSVINGLPTQNIDAQLTTGGIIEGRVTGEGGMGIPHIGVQAFDETENYKLYWGNTINDGPNSSLTGTYQIVVPGGNAPASRTYKIIFNPYPYDIYYLPQIFNGKPYSTRLSDADPVYVTNGQFGLPQPDATLALGGIISGMVYAADSPDPQHPLTIQNVCVSVYKNGIYVDQIRTGWPTPDGTYKMTVPAGSGYHVSIYDCGAPEYYLISGTQTLQNAVVAGQTYPVQVNFAVGKGGRISGRVYDAGNPDPNTNGIKNACIGVEDIASGNLITTAWTGDDGSYTTNTIPANVAYKVRIDQCNATGYYLFNKYYSGSVQAPLGATEIGIDFPLDKGGAIVGKVVDSQGIGIPNVNVQINDGNCNYITWTNTVSSGADIGSFSIALPVGIYKIGFFPWDANLYYLSEWYDNKASCNQANTVSVLAEGVDYPISPDIVLTDGARIDGYVKNVSGVGINNVNVSFFTTNNVFVAGTGTYDDSLGNSGYYNVAIPVGTYKIQFNTQNAGNYVMEWYNDAPDFNSAQTTPALQIGQTTRLNDVQLLAPATLTISGCVRDANTNAGIPDVVMNGLPGNPKTGSNGCYSTNISYGWGSWSGRVTPFHVGYTLNPSYRDYVNINSNQPNQNYIGDPVLFNLYEDFSGQEINPEKWDNWAQFEKPEGSLYKIPPILIGNWDLVREIRNNELFSKTIGYGRTTQNRLEFINPNSVNYLKADLRVDQIEGNYDSLIPARGALAAAGLTGAFYNDGTGSGVPGSYLGDINAQVRIFKWREGQVMADWEVIRFSNDDGSQFTVLGSGTFSDPIILGSSNQLTLEWNPGSGLLTFWFNGTSDTWQGPIYPNAPNVPSKALRTYIGIIDTAQGELVSDPNLGGKITAAFDNAEARTSAGGSILVSDSFSSMNLDAARWATQELVREIVNGKLVSKSKNINQNTRIINNLNFKYQDQINEFQAKVVLHEHSINKGSMSARLGGNFYNDTGNPQSGAQGDVWAQVSLTVNPGQAPFANWVVLRFIDPNAAQGVWTVLGSGTFPMAINLGQAYNLSLQWDLDNNQFTFKCDDFVSYFRPNSATKYPPNLKMKRLDTNISPPSPFSNFEGFISASFDDVVVGPPQIWTITGSAGPNGSISPLGPIMVNNGANRTFTITPNSGYAVADVVVDGNSQGPLPSYTFTNVTANHTITATFTENTPAGGGGTPIQPIDSTTSTTPVSVTFTDVTSSGSTYLTTNAVPAEPPSGFELSGTYYDLSTTAAFSGPVEVCIHYTGVAEADEPNLRLLHYETATWVDRTTHLDVVTDTICAVVTSFSPFAVMAVPPAVIPSIKTGSVELSPSPAFINDPVILSAILDGRFEGNSNVALPVATAEFSTDGGQTWQVLWSPQGGAVGSPVENVSAAIGPFPEAGAYQVCVRGRSYSGNFGNPECIPFSVRPANQPPVLAPIGNQMVVEGQTLEFVVSATDPEGQVLTYLIGNPPSGAQFDPTTGQFSWAPSFDQAGSYTDIRFTVTDNGQPPASASEVITITVGNKNRPPVFDPPLEDKTVFEDELLQFTVSAIDLDGDSLTFSAENLPPGAHFDPETKVFSWTPTFEQADSYTNVEFTVMDSGSPLELATQTITITVGNTNRPPVFTSIGTQLQWLEGQPLEFTIQATDHDGDRVTFSANNLPPGALIDPSTGKFYWLPDFTQAGSYSIEFLATDDKNPPATGSMTVIITIGNVPTPCERAQEIIGAVLLLHLPKSVENSYLAHLKKVCPFVEDGKKNPAVNQLQAFVQKVQQDIGSGKIGMEAGNRLIGMADALLALIQG